MKRFSKKLITAIAIILTFLFAGIVKDKMQLRRDMIRLHVVANSNTEADQKVKRQVRDAVLSTLRSSIPNGCDASMAKDYIHQNIPQLEAAANAVLESAGFDDRAAVSLLNEEYPVRHYETFSLPSGVYQSLKVVIGSGEGENWWCVVFPNLCEPVTTDAFHKTSESSGISATLDNALCVDRKYEIRFFLLDCLGKIENFFRFG